MIPFLAPEWIAALDAAAQGVRLPEEVRLVVQQVVEVPGAQDVAYHLLVTGDRMRVLPGPAPAPDVTVTSAYPVAAAISRGELNAQAALVAGTLRLTGDLAVLMRHARTLAGMEDVFAKVRDVTRY